MENSYLFIIANKNLFPLRARLKELGAFYTGVGYALPTVKETEALAFCQSADIQIHKQPLPSGHTFESFMQSHKAAFFRDKAVVLERKIEPLKKELKLEEHSNNHLKVMESLQESPRGKFLLELLEDYEEVVNQLKSAEKYEKALSQQDNLSPSIKFISELQKNLLVVDPPEIPRLVNFSDGDKQKPFLRKGILAMLVGAGGVGKTHALTQLALSIATGYPWLGLFPIETPGHVFLGLGENNHDDIHRLLRKVTKHLMNHSNSINQFHFFDPDPLKAAAERLAIMSFSGVNATFIHQGQPTHFFTALLSNLKEKEPQNGWSCIILDPISRFIGLEAETDNASATQFIALLERMSMDLKGNPTIVFGHHMNKGGVSGLNTDQAAARGSSAITDGVRWQVNLERVKTDSESESDAQPSIIFRHVKSNFTSILKKFTLKKDELGCLYINQEPAEEPTRAYKPSSFGNYISLGSINKSSLSEENDD